MKKLAQYIVEQLVNHPQEVRVEEEEDGVKATIRIYVHQDDAGTIIGKKGFVIRAIRQLLYAADRRQHRSIIVDVISDRDQTSPVPAPPLEGEA